MVVETFVKKVDGLFRKREPVFYKSNCSFRVIPECSFLKVSADWNIMITQLILYFPFIVFLYNLK